MTPEFSTKRTFLRHWKESDKEPFFRMNSDPEVMEFFPATLSREDSDALADRNERELQQSNYGLWAVELPGVAPFIGFLGLHYHDFPASFTPCVEIGWRLAKEHWRQGYAFEAASRALQYGLSEIHLPEIVSFTALCNIPSIRLMEKLGLHQKKEFDHPMLDEGHPLRRHVLYTTKAPV